jgi:alkanesulfonate monooxygenase SsuD/methylene tetrahydromethanopterin reductase-like flavin-dependent oxidoreductase (luciferase family)
VTHTTKYFELDEITVEPKPQQKPHPPIWIAGAHFGERNERQMRRIAKYGDGFVSTLITPEEYRDIHGKIMDIAEQMGRRRSDIHGCLYMSVNLNEDRAAAAREGNEFLTKYYGSTFWGDRWGPFGAASELVQNMQSFADAGVATFVIRFAAADQAKQLSAFGRDVFPSFR